MPASERYEKGLGHDVVRFPVAQPSRDIALDGSSMPIVKLGERLGLVPGLLDQRSVIRPFPGWRSHAGLRSMRVLHGHSLLPDPG